MATFIHNLSDAGASVGVIIAGTLIVLYQWYWLDLAVALCSEPISDTTKPRSGPGFLLYNGRKYDWRMVVFCMWMVSVQRFCFSHSLIF
ncbi:hypothetical protein [Indioceanicola profundi]|uniref:hypothetical protein n=1 Tax=Indioceanicola profundi TaxID=2220096 RepID=UPI001CEDF575|nr:hypothetical protein [Indioceanicola profundi]